MANIIMRMTVVLFFGIVGLVLLFSLMYGNLRVDLEPTILDIFKIWLGASIGISTNILQRREQAPVARKE